MARKTYDEVISSGGAHHTPPDKLERLIMRTISNNWKEGPNGEVIQDTPSLIEGILAEHRGEQEKEDEIKFLSKELKKYKIHEK